MSIRGTAVSPQLAAVSFVSSRTGALSHIQIPIGQISGTPGALVWIAADQAGRPGAVLEQISLGSVRAQPPVNTVESPAHVFSTVHPQLNAGTKYWLIVGPAGGDTNVSWNKTMNNTQDDVSFTNNPNFLLSTSNSVAGPWTAAPAAPQVAIRPAFEIDLRE